MKKHLAFTIILIFAMASSMIIFNPAHADTGDYWVSKAPMHVARAGLGVAVVNGKIYAIGGSTASGFEPSIPPSSAYGNINLGGFVGTNEEYDPATDAWTYRAPMPTPRMALAIAAYQNKIYCIGGRSVAGDVSGGYTAVNEVYDPVTNTWETKAPMPTATGWLIANVVDDKIYVIDYSGKNYVYEPATNSWTTKPPVPASAFMGYASAVLDKKIYVIGGLTPDQDSNQNSIYDTQTDKWSAGTPPPSSQGGGAAGATTGVMAPKRVYVFGERANLKPGENTGFVRVYNPKNDGWTYGADSPTDRYNFGVTALNDTFYVIGGHTYNLLGNFAPTGVTEEYTPIGYGTPDPSYVLEHTPPKISLLSPLNQTYSESSVSLVFTVDKAVNWTTYSLDGQQNATITGNTTITGLSGGLHNITIYANDTFGNMGASQSVNFSTSQPFPVATVAAVSGAIVVVVVAAGLLVYFKKHKH